MNLFMLCQEFLKVSKVRVDERLLSFETNDGSLELVGHCVRRFTPGIAVNEGFGPCCCTPFSVF